MHSLKIITTSAVGRSIIFFTNLSPSILAIKQPIPYPNGQSLPIKVNYIHKILKIDFYADVEEPCSKMTPVFQLYQIRPHFVG